MTYKQFELQLKTWKREMRPIYEEIKMLADSYGLLTKRNEISKNKKKKKQYDAFISRYKQQYGSYTSFIKKQREKRKKSISEYVNELIKKGVNKNQAEKESKKKFAGKNAKEYFYTMKSYNDLITEMFERYSSNEARGYLDYAETLDLVDAIDYLYEVVKYGETHNVNPLRGLY